MAFPAFHIQRLRLVARFVGHIMIAELGARDTALDSAFGSAHVGCSGMLNKAARATRLRLDPVLSPSQLQPERLARAGRGHGDQQAFMATGRAQGSVQMCRGVNSRSVYYPERQIRCNKEFKFKFEWSEALVRGVFLL